MEKIPYTKALKGTSDGAAIFYLQTEPVPTAAWLMVQHTVEEDETSDFDSLRVGYGRSLFDITWWEEHITCVAGRLYWQERDMHVVPELNRVIFAFYGTEDGDTIRALVEGYTTPKVLSRAPFKPRKRERRGE